MTTQIIDRSDAVVVLLRSGQLNQDEVIAAAVDALRDGKRKAAELGKSLDINLQGVKTLSAAAIGRLVQIGKEAKEANQEVRFTIPRDLEGMFRILRLDNLFSVQVADHETNGVDSANMAAASSTAPSTSG